MSKIDTDENRFHALKFALQYFDALDCGVGPEAVTDAAALFLAFLDGAETPTQSVEDEDAELADLTESYPADELVAEDDAEDEAEDYQSEPDSWAAADRAISDAALVEELVEDGSHEETEVEAEAEEDEAVAYDNPFIPAVTAEDDAPTEAEITDAVEQIASPPPPAPDETDAPEMTDEQVERYEDRTREERELETVDAYINPLPDTGKKYW